MDEAGRRYIPGYAVWTGVGETVSDARFYSCPIAQIEQGVTRDLVRLHRLVSIDGVALSDVVAEPTAAALDALDVIRTEQSAIRARVKEQDDTIRAARQGAKMGRVH